MLPVLQQLGVTWKDVFLAGLVVGVWFAGRNRTETGKRIGVIEDAVAEVRGLLKAISPRSGDGK